MSCIQITASHLASLPSASPLRSFQHNIAPKIPLTFLRIKTKFPKLSLNLTSATSRHQRAPTVRLFGGKGKFDNVNKGSRWELGSFGKEQSIEELLKQQIEKQEYYEGGGDGGKPPPSGGGGGGGGGGFGEGEDGGGLKGVWDEFSQVILATMGFIFLYIYIIEGEEMTVLFKDLLRLLFKRQKSLRLKRIIEDCEEFFRRMKEKPAYDPYWLEREILNTTTCYDGPAKYNYILRTLEKLEARSKDGYEPTSDDEQY